MKFHEDLKNKVVGNLLKLGLTEEQAQLYLLLFQQGPLSVVQMSRKLSWGRNKVYRVVDELINLGVVTEIKRLKGSVFQALDFNALENLVASKEIDFITAKEGLGNLTSILPYLDVAKSVSSKVIHYRGIEGLKQVNWNLVHADGVYRVYEMSRLSDYLDFEFAEALRREWLVRGIRSMDLTNDKEISDHTNVVEFTEKLSEYRYIDPNKLRISSEVYIYNDVVAVLQYDTVKTDPNSIFCVEIYNQALADFQKQIFDLLWEQSTPLKIVSKRGARRL